MWLMRPLGVIFFEFHRFNYVSNGFEHEINPVEWGARVWGWVADPIAYLYVVGVFVWAPGDVGGDDVLTSFV